MRAEKRRRGKQDIEASIPPKPLVWVVVVVAAEALPSAAQRPILADVAGASIHVDAAAVPLRQMLPGVACRTERVRRIDPHSSEIEFDDGTGALSHQHYDHVVFPCGTESNLGMILAMTGLSALYARKESPRPENRADGSGSRPSRQLKLGRPGFV